jgi:hypothetical protein
MQGPNRIARVNLASPPYIHVTDDTLRTGENASIVDENIGACEASIHGECAAIDVGK